MSLEFDYINEKYEFRLTLVKLHIWRALSKSHCFFVLLHKQDSYFISLVVQDILSKKTYLWTVVLKTCLECFLNNFVS
jgi:hypothetical protein